MNPLATGLGLTLSLMGEACDRLRSSHKLKTAAHQAEHATANIQAVAS